jgi:hypothetical protein
MTSSHKKERFFNRNSSFSIYDSLARIVLYYLLYREFGDSRQNALYVNFGGTYSTYGTHGTVRQGKIIG